MTTKLITFSIPLLLIISTLVVGVMPVYAQTSRPQPYSQLALIEAKPVDPRVIVLQDYLAKYNSPLRNYAKDFIEAADTYNLDWKLVPAITGVESTFGKRTPGSYNRPSYNGWGWGVYGDQALGFQSWRHGIFTVSEGLRKNYVDKGYVTPQQMNKKYASSLTWGSKVTYFMNDLQKFAEAHPSYKTQNTLELSFGKNVAGTSAKLALSN